MSQVRYLVLRCSASRCVTCNLTGIFYFSNKFLHLTGVRLQRAVEFVFALVGLHLFYDFFFPFEKICLEWRPLMSCFRTSHHTQIHQSDCLLRSFFSFCSCCEGGKTPRKIARACLCKQRKDFCRNEELALVKSTLVCCTCTDFSPSLRHQSESHAFTSVCHFVWHFPFFFLATTCIRHKLQSRESLAPRLLPIFVVWTVVCLIMFFLKPQPSTSSSPVVFILATFLCKQAK